MLRCSGWNTTLSATQCGLGYTSSASQCAGCAPGFFPELGACAPCPVSNAVQVITILFFVAALGGAFVAVVASVYALSRKSRAPVSFALFRGRDFVMWAMITWQTVVQVGKRITAAPASVRSILNALAVLELDSSVVVNPACYSSYPFMQQQVEFIGSLAAVAGVLLLFLIPLPTKKSSLPTLRRLSMSVLMLLYPLVCNSALNMVHCALGEDGQLVLSSNSQFRCYAGPHLRVGVLAWLVILFHILGFPVVTFMVLYRRRRLMISVPPSFLSAWGTFVAQDFKPQRFWFVHMNLVTVFILSVLLTFVPTAPSTPLGVETISLIVTSVVIIANLTALFKLDPYSDKRRWKQPVKALALGVTWVMAVAVFVSAMYVRGQATSAAANGLAYVVLCVIIALIIVFLIQFGRTITRELTSTVKAVPADSDKVVMNPMLRQTPKAGPGGGTPLPGSPEAPMTVNPFAKLRLPGAGDTEKAGEVELVSRPSPTTRVFKYV